MTEPADIARLPALHQQQLVLVQEDANGKIIGEYRSAGLRPYTLDKAKQFGFDQAYLEACL